MWQNNAKKKSNNNNNIDSFINYKRKFYIIQLNYSLVLHNTSTMK